MKIRPELLGVLALITTAVLWGSNHVAARASNGAIPLSAFVFWRWTLAVLPMTVLAWPSIRRHRVLIRENLADLCFIGTIGVGIFSVLLIGGAYYSLAIEVSMINATTPAWVAAIGLIKGDGRLSPVQWLGLALAFLGTLLIITQGHLGMVFSMEARPGNIMALVGAIVFGWFSTRLKRYSGRLPAFTLTTVTAAFGTAIVALPYYLVSVLVLGSGAIATSADQTWFAILVILYVAIGPTMIGNACYVYGLSVIGPQRAAAFLYLSPVASSVLAVLLLGESLHMYHFAGYALIVAGLLLVNKPSRSTTPQSLIRQ
ncbi:DMT family transporter [Microbaculum marinum]|uniref:DMT family transporter n=1 Tax=Microbaculum marinum TaxID=1764581 RepID=A0AAW9RT98_9HYPH